MSRKAQQVSSLLQGGKGSNGSSSKSGALSLVQASRKPSKAQASTDGVLSEHGPWQVRSYNGNPYLCSGSDPRHKGVSVWALAQALDYPGDTLEAIKAVLSLRDRA